MLRPVEYNPPTHRGLEILFKDDFIIALNKPSGLLSVPGRGIDKQDCMISRLLLEYPQALVIHRLDMATSGILLFALNKEVQKQIGLLFEHRKITKQYIAKVHGKLREISGVINQPLMTDWNNRPKQKIDYKQGKPSQTRFKLIKVDENNNSLVHLSPLTGRSHQLRVHMSSLGHAILGDDLYGTAQSRNASKRLLLHAQKISFIHPVTNTNLEINSDAQFI